ncbi:MAG: hypothetical protein GEV08_20795 [Acidimicrobiia bacterium]|nr:hypothetical protein [Acidimicrobiia bacterium]
MATAQSTSRPDLPPPGRPPRRRRRWPWVTALGVLAVLALGAGAALVWLFDDDSPPAVSLEAATAALASSTTEGEADAATTTAAAQGAPAASTPAPASSGIAGAWAVDTSLGTFDYEAATGSFAGFRIAEELRGIGSATAVGRTPAVSGALTIEGTTLRAATVEADMTALTTNDSRRDDRALGALEVQQFPTANFVLTQPIELGEAAASGSPVEVTAMGDLTIHGVARPVQLPLQAQLSGETIVVVGSLPITFSDYGVETPSAQIVLSVEDHGVMEVQLLFTRQ